MERGIYRIIDANFNRAREGLRVMEEFCRFVLDSADLSGRAKQLRHKLTGAMERVDYDKLLACRDSAEDVGSGLKVDGQMKRNDLVDSFTAAARRATEALRAIAETAAIIDSGLAGECESIRFEVYSLEKDVIKLAGPKSKLSGMRLYVLITVNKTVDSVNISELVKQCADGGADCLQLRCKGLDDVSIFNLAVEFVDECRKAGIVSIVNDRADIAISAGADGVHIGKEDLPIGQVRRLGAKPMIVGVTTHCVEELEEAIRSGADYVGIGPVFGTKTKPGLKTAGLEYVKEAVVVLDGSGVPHVAIGGIGEENIETVIEAGARAVAVCSAVTGSEDPEQVCKKLKIKLESA